MYDVTIIGAGISGCSLAYELSKYNVNAVLVEKENDVSIGTTKANSAIIHAGYDPEPGTDMAKYNVAGCAYTAELCKKLDVPYKNIGSLVVAFAEDEMPKIQELYDRGNENGCPGLEIWDAEKLHAEEPNLNECAVGALYAPTAGVVSPWELAIACAEIAVTNGIELRLNTEVTNVEKMDGGYKVVTNNGVIETKLVVNCAGVHADKVNEFMNEKKFTIVPNKGEYYLLDKSQGTLVNHVIFQCPNEKGKGVLVSPTVHGNLIVGPNSIPTVDTDLGTTLDGLDFVREAALKSVPTINYRDSIRNFAGLRARTGVHDFFIYEDEVNKGFFNEAGMASPGLTSACAVAVDMAKKLADRVEAAAKDEYVDERHQVRFKHMSHAERAELIKENPLYGKIICRCESVTEGEIVDALHRPFVAASIDAIKRRCNAGMGRCQGGFCGPRVQEIIARELGMAQPEVVKDRAGMFIITGETKNVGGAN